MAYGMEEQQLQKNDHLQHLPVSLKYFYNDRVSVYHSRPTEETQGRSYEVIEDFPKLIELWCPNYQDLPSLGVTFEDMWKPKVSLLRALGDSMELKDARSFEWNIDEGESL